MTALLESKLHKRKQRGNLRKLSIDEDLIDFASNDYLGLARSVQLFNAILLEVESFRKVGSTGSRLLTGNSAYAEELESKIAAFHGYEAGTLFNCGYMANAGLLSTIGQPETVIFYDAAIHASSHDGMRLSKAHCFPFRHNDLNHLEKRLRSDHQYKSRYICVESVYSTDGSMAPLQEMACLANRYNAHLIVDEAHAVGVLGPLGRGLVSHYGLTKNVCAQIVTFGKALGCFGAIVLGSNVLRTALINFATPYIYTTALPYTALASIKCSYDLFPKLEKERQQLYSLMAPCQRSATHIQSIPVKGNEAVQQAAQKLKTSGFAVSPLKSPTVKQGQEKLRICLHAFNTHEELKQLLEVLI